MKRISLLVVALILISCDQPGPTAPFSALELNAPSFATFPGTVVVNGDGTSTLTFQPGPGLNDGTDQGTVDAGKDGYTFSLSGGGNGDSGWAHHFLSTCNNFRSYSYYRFDVEDLPAADDVVSVELHLWHNMNRSYGWPWQASVTKFALHEVTSGWEENALRWYAPPSHVPTPVATADLDTSHGRPNGGGNTIYFEGWKSMDVTDLYGRWQAAPVTNKGLMYKRTQAWCENANAEYVAQSDMVDVPESIFDTRAEYRPKLVITYRSEPSNQDPTVTIDGPLVIDEGSSITLDGVAGDPDGDALTYSWLFDDGATFSTSSVTRSYADDGAHNGELRVDDQNGGIASATHAFTVRNVAPAVAALPGALLLAGETYGSFGSFSDPGADSWSGTVDYGTGAKTLALAGTGFDLSHTFTTAGSYTVTVTVTDDDGGAGSASATVDVMSAGEWLDLIIAKVRTFDLNKGVVNSLVAKLQNAKKSIGRGNMSAAMGQLNAFQNELNALARSGRLDAGLVAECADALSRLFAVLS